MGILQRTRAHFVFRSCQDRMGVRAQTNIQRMYKLCFLLIVSEAARLLDEIGDKKNYLSHFGFWETDSYVTRKFLYLKKNSNIRLHSSVNTHRPRFTHTDWSL